MNVSDRILKPLHIKSGLILREDDHVITMFHNGRVIRRYAIEGLMSPDQILKDADDYIASKMNALAGGIYYPQKSIGDSLAETGKVRAYGK